MPDRETGPLSETPGFPRRATGRPSPAPAARWRFHGLSQAAPSIRHTRWEKGEGRPSGVSRSRTPSGIDRQSRAERLPHDRRTPAPRRTSVRRRGPPLTWEETVGLRGPVPRRGRRKGSGRPVTAHWTGGRREEAIDDRSWEPTVACWNSEASTPFLRRRWRQRFGLEADQGSNVGQHLPPLLLAQSVFPRRHRGAGLAV